YAKKTNPSSRTTTISPDVLRVDIHWAGVNAGEIRRSVAALVALTPDVMLATGTPILEALLGATRSLPIVFVGAGDPVGTGYVESLRLHPSWFFRTHSRCASAWLCRHATNLRRSEMTPLLPK